jgi:uridine monophosphate synthetase
MQNRTAKVAAALYNSGCLNFGSFKIKSGAISPYYIDLARLLASPKELCNIVEITTSEIKKTMTSDRIDKLASIELKGALILPSVACKVGLPCIVVRKQEKTYGATGRIVGAEVSEGEKILFFDDVISEGLSKLEGIKPLEELGARIRNVLVVVDREQGGKKNLEKLGYEVHALAKVSDIVNSLLEAESISKEQTDAVMNYIRRSSCEA